MKWIVYISVFFFWVQVSFTQCNKPFPSHVNYSSNSIKPNNYSQSSLDNHTATFYEAWKTAYLKNDCGVTSQFYVFSGNGAKNVSEAQGYGMMITAYFAGQDAYAKMYFDGLYQFYKAHPSQINNALMDWQQVSCSDSPSSDDDAASDGDIDIAFALLLAHVQWGSDQEINYLEEAITILHAIEQDEVNSDNFIVKLGDWCSNDNVNYYYATRPSDFIIDHFKVFRCVGNSLIWDNVVNECYSLVEAIQNDYSPTTGLLPDFIINTNSNPIPAGPNFLEDVTDGEFAYNACRTPWRLGLDYLLNEDVRAQEAVLKMNNWFKNVSSGDVSALSNGYSLNGAPTYNWADPTFIGPMAVGAMLDVNNQVWLNDLYNELVINNSINDGDYYSNTLKLLSMLVLSKNYWAPSCSDLSYSIMEVDTNQLFPNPVLNGLLYWNISEQIDTVMFYDLLGNKLIEQEVNGNNCMSVSTLHPGCYFIHFVNKHNQNVLTRKIIIE
jgi:endoglucanase